MVKPDLVINFERNLSNAIRENKTHAPCAQFLPRIIIWLRQIFKRWNLIKLQVFEKKKKHFGLQIELWNVSSNFSDSRCCRALPLKQKKLLTFNFQRRPFEKLQIDTIFNYNYHTIFAANLIINAHLSLIVTLQIRFEWSALVSVLTSATECSVEWNHKNIAKPFLQTMQPRVTRVKWKTNKLLIKNANFFLLLN